MSPWVTPPPASSQRTPSNVPPAGSGTLRGPHARGRAGGERREHRSADGSRGAAVSASARPAFSAPAREGGAAEPIAAPSTTPADGADGERGGEPPVERGHRCTLPSWLTIEPWPEAVRPRITKHSPAEPLNRAW